MKLLVDMNLSPRLAALLNAAAGIEALHWSTVGAANAADSEIMAFAQANNYVIITQDLDFGIMLAASKDSRPSVVQLRTGDVSPELIDMLVIRALNQMSPDLAKGALLTIDPRRTRLRLLPLGLGRPAEKD